MITVGIKVIRFYWKIKSNSEQLEVKFKTQNLALPLISSVRSFNETIYTFSSFDS